MPGNIAPASCHGIGQNASPWNALVPDLVTTFTAPDEVRLFERSRLDCATENSEMALAGMSWVVVPTFSSRNVHAVHLNAGAAAETAAERNRGETVLGRVEVSAVLNLNARLELSQIQEVASIDRQIFDLLGGQRTGDLRLVRIDLHCFAGDFDHGGRRTNL